MHRPSGNPPNYAIGEFLPLSLLIKKPHLWWSFFMERETRLVSCSVACNGISRFANVISSQSQKRSSLSSFAQLAKRLHQIKRPLELKSYGLLISGRRGSNSRHPPWQGGILPLNYPRLCFVSQDLLLHKDFFFASTFLNYFMFSILLD